MWNIYIYIYIWVPRHNGSPAFMHTCILLSFFCSTPLRRPLAQNTVRVPKNYQIVKLGDNLHFQISGFS